MKIPVGEFGYAPGQLGGRAEMPAGAAIQQGTAELGAAGMKLGREAAADDSLDKRIEYGEAHRQRLEAEQVAREAKRSQATVVHAKAQNALADAHDQIKQGVENGTIGVDAAPKLWADQSTKIVDDHIQTVDRANAELVRAGLEQNLGTFGRSINQAITARNRHDVGASLVDYLEEMQRFWLRDPAAAKRQGVMAIDARAPLAGYNPEQVAKMRHSFIELGTFNEAKQTLNGSMNDAVALDRFIDALPEMPDLSPDKKNALESTALHMKAALEAKGVAAEARRVSQVGRVIDKIETRIAMGIPVDPSDITRVSDAARGTEHEDRAASLAEDQQVVAEVLKRPLAQQEAFATHLKQELMTTGKVNPRMVSLVDRTVKNGIELYKTNSMAYAANRTGAIVDPLDMAKPETWSDNLAHRADVWAGLERQTGVKPGGPLFPQEVRTFASAIGSGNLNLRRSLLGQLKDGLGDKAYLAAMQQIAPDDPVLAAAGVASARGHDARADAILRGHDLLRPSKKEDGSPAGGKVLPMPSDGDLMKLWSTRARDAFAENSEVGSLYFQSAKAIYAKMSDQAGDLSGILSPSRWSSAMDEATGGFEKYRGRTIVLPYNVPYSQFRDGLKDRFAMLVQSGTLDKTWTVDRLMDLPLQNRGDAKYILRAGDGKLVDTKGRDVVIDFDAPLPFKPSGERR